MIGFNFGTITSAIARTIRKLKDYYTGESVGEWAMRKNYDAEWKRTKDFILVDDLCDITDANTVEDFRRKSEYYEKMVNGK